MISYEIPIKVHMVSIRNSFMSQILVKTYC